MNLLLDGILKTSTLILATWLITALPMRWTAAARHLVWLVTVIVAVLIPIVIAVLPSWELRVLQPPPVVADVTSIAQPDAQSESVREASRSVPSPAPANGWHPVRVVVALWLIGVAIAIIRVAWGWISVSRIARENTTEPGEDWLSMLSEVEAALNLKSGVKTIIGERIRVPGVWGVLRPKLLLPVDALRWDRQRRRLVLLHELAHIQRHDCLAQTVAQVMHSIHWFNPLAALASKRLREEQERACDDVVLQKGVSSDEYANHLLDIALASRGDRFWQTATVSMARSSSIATRLRAVLDSGQNRRPVDPAVYGGSILFACAAVLMLSTMRVTARETVHIEIQATPTSKPVTGKESVPTNPGTPPVVPPKSQKKPDFSGTWVRAGSGDEWPFGNYETWIIRQGESEIRLDATSAYNGTYHMVWYFNRWGKRWDSDWTNQIGRVQWDGPRLVTVTGAEGDEVRYPWIFELSADGKTITAESVRVGNLGLSFDFESSSISQVYVRHRLVYAKVPH